MISGELQPCGTRGAYQRHRAYGQVPCDACTRAHTAYNKRMAYRRRQNTRRKTQTEAQLDRDLRALVHVLACALGVGRRSA